MVSGPGNEMMVKKGYAVARREALTLLSAPAIVAGMPGSGRAMERSDVIVIGAGLAGLHAAMLLEAEGFNVLVLEGNNRIGGRVLTMDDVDGKPEAGGQQIGPLHARVRSAVTDLGLHMYKPDLGWTGLTVITGGQTVDGADWRDSPHNKLAGEERRLLPFQLLKHYIDSTNPMQAFDDWLEPDFAHLDIPLSDYLKGVGASDEALRQMAVANYTELEAISALGELRRELFLTTAYSNGTFDYLEGGMSRLPEAMAASLKSDVRLGHVLEGIIQSNGSVEVRCVNGNRFAAQAVICAVPFSTLRNVVFEPKLPHAKDQVIAQLPYARVTNIFFDVLEPFWGLDGLPPLMWTDSPIERVFTIPGAGGSVASLWCLINGEADRRFAGLSDDEVKVFALNWLVKLRPAAKDRVKPVRVYSWSRNPFAKGHVAYYGPGQIVAFKSEISKAVSRIHFAGEHTAELHYGMEAAMESGERAAFETLEAIG